MNSQAILRDIVKRIRKEVRPRKIVLFGSRARGHARRRSDYDILIVKRSRLPSHRRTGRVYAALSDLPVPIDVVMYTPGEVREWRNASRAFVTTALREGKVLYEDKR
jgi:predicted nucleotidyltransferase